MCTQRFCDVTNYHMHTSSSQYPFLVSLFASVAMLWKHHFCRTREDKGDLRKCFWRRSHSISELASVLQQFQHEHHEG